MNIMIMIPSLGGGGAEWAATVVGDYLSKKGHAVCYFLLDRGYEKTAYKIPKTVFFLELDSFLNNIKYCRTSGFFIKNILMMARQVGKVKQDNRIDVTISFMETCNYLNALSGWKDRKILSVRTVLSTYLGVDYFHSPKLLRFVYSQSDMIIAVSKFVEEDLCRAYGVDNKKIVVIPNASIRHGDVQKKEEWLFGSSSVIYIGRLEIEKQVDRIIRAFSYTVKKCRKAQLVILGRGSHREYLEWISRNLNIYNNIHFMGFVDDMGYYLRNACCFVMASREEGFPNAMIEAMSYGTPVISTDSPGGCREILGKEKKVTDIEMCKYGIITPYIKGKAPRHIFLEKEEILLGDAMAMLINNQSLREMYCRQSLIRASFYSYDRIMRSWDKVLKC